MGGRPLASLRLAIGAALGGLVLLVPAGILALAGLAMSKVGADSMGQGGAKARSGESTEGIGNVLAFLDFGLGCVAFLLLALAAFVLIGGAVAGLIGLARHRRSTPA